LSNYIFVYGTLRRGFLASKEYMSSSYVEFVEEGFVNGKLFEVSGYPGLILTNTKEVVYGEVYRVDSSYIDKLLEKLDEYEGCSRDFREPYEYKRVKTKVTLQNSKVIEAWVYIYNLDTSTLEPIKSGDYLEYKNS